MGDLIRIDFHNRGRLPSRVEGRSNVTTEHHRSVSRYTGKAAFLRVLVSKAPELTLVEDTLEKTDFEIPQQRLDEVVRAFFDCERASKTGASREEIRILEDKLIELQADLSEDDYSQFLRLTGITPTT